MIQFIKFSCTSKQLLFIALLLHCHRRSVQVLFTDAFLLGRSVPSYIYKRQQWNSLLLEAASNNKPAIVVSSSSSAVNNKRSARHEHFFESKCKLLEEYIATHGHANVHAKVPILGCWVSRIRKAKSQYDRGEKTTLLTPERIAKLNALGFCWDPMEEQFDKMISQLVQFREQYGHCNVPKDYRENKTLGAWVSHQRSYKLKLDRGLPSPMKPDRIARLEALGFDWRSHPAKYTTLNNTKQRTFSWERMHRALEDYKMVHGHVNVPASVPHLGEWVALQRTEKANYDCGLMTNLTTERISKLNNLGFCWDTQLANMTSSREQTDNSTLAIPLDFSSPSNLSDHDVIITSEKILQDDSKHQKLKTSHILKYLRRQDVRWESMLKQLEAYRATYGVTEVPKNWEPNKKLGRWLGWQRLNRNRYIRGIPSPATRERILALERLGVKWKINYSWEERLEMMKEFLEKNDGSFIIPQNHTAAPKSLRNWMNKQRSIKKAKDRGKVIRGMPSDKQIATLDEMGFAWNYRQERWNQKMAELQAFKERFGHCNVPLTWEENRALAIWVRRQRSVKTDIDRGGTCDELTPQRISALDEMGFVWYPFDVAWEKMRQQLEGFRSQYGHCNVPYRWPENQKLASWVFHHRRYKRMRDCGRSSPLTKYRFETLDAMGFSWDTPSVKDDLHFRLMRRRRQLEEKWDFMFKQLQDLVNEHGTLDVPIIDEKHRELNFWMSQQRKAKARLERSKQDGWVLLNADRIASLDSIGFSWDPRVERWESMFQKLKTFKSRFGHCNVPQSHCLASWVNWQRLQKRKYDRGEKDAEINADRFAALDSLGFVWDPMEVKWQKKYHELIEYRKQYGNCNVPFGWPPNPQLGWWVFEMRALKKKYDRGEKVYETTVKHLAALDELGFVWNFSEAQWQEKFQQLVEYKNQYGNCNVPTRWRHNRKLGRWVDSLRYAKRKYDTGIPFGLNEKKIAALEEIGFQWRLRTRRESLTHS